MIDFNSGWMFRTENGERVPVTLPHDAMRTETRYAACRGGVQTGFFPGGRYVYEKTFFVEKAWLSQQIDLRFEGVYRNVTVLVNGQKAAFHAYGYTEFAVDISAFVKVGENAVTVEVDNSLVPNCRWYTGSGIYRPVSLVVRDRAHIENLRVKTVSISPAVIEASADCALPLTVALFDGETLLASGRPGAFTLPGAELWDADHPKLYTCTVSSETDSVSVRFGVRTLSWSAQTGLLVNGKRTLLRGGCLHSDNGVLGACSFYDAEVRRVRILKEQGFNALRMAHNPAARALLDACDELGMYVMDECFDGWYTPKDYHDYARQFLGGYRDDLRSMVEKDRNHPCVLLYSLGNEVTETTEAKGVALCKEMRDYVHSLDDTRPVVCGINVLLNVYTRLGIGVYRDRGVYKPEPLPEGKGYRERKTGSAFFNAVVGKLGWLMLSMSRGRLAEKLVKDVASALDVVGLNYASTRYDPDAKKYPDRLMAGTETMVKDLPYNWERVKRYPQLIGDFVWAVWDYLGEACIGDWTYHSYKGLPLLSGQGMIDLTGKPLASMAFMQVVWGMRREPFIAVSPLNHAGETPDTGAWQFTNAIDSWTWQGYEGKKTTVEVYADADTVRLERNGKVLGTQRVRRFRAVFRVRYQSGTLTAVALDANGTETGRASLQTGGDETVLTVRCDRGTLCANGQDLCYIEIEFTDRNGVLKPSIEQRVELAVSGAATLAGFGSALCKTDEVFDKAQHNSYRGRCLAVLRAGSEAGKAEITVSSAGVSPITKEIEVLA